MLGLCFSNLGFWGHVPPEEAGNRATEAVNKALELDQSLALAHAVRGWIAFYYEWDFAGCEREVNLALKLNRSEWQAHGTLAVLQFIARRNIRVGIALTREMLQLDPLSLYTNTNAAWFFVFAGDYERASDHAYRTVDMFPDALHAWYALGQAQLGLYNFGEAIDAFERAVAISRDAISLGYLGSALGQAGRTGEAEALLRELLERSAREYVSPKGFITLYAGLGDIDRAFEWVEEAFQRRDSTVLFLDVVPVFDPLRGDARFPKILQRVGLPPPRHLAAHT
jgi:tetratricopeptide (TPR) repeat protein